ncbi:hypothetical protein ACI7YU_12455 [Pseudomonas siliginis]|uniref:hypothetical protein n=1 Tax=Pseudomonas siliginis TaxID=2842346 RepID=UPI00386C98E2
MNQTPDENRILALNPPFVLKQAVLKDGGYDGGISLETVENDLLIIVDPWVGMAMYDNCKMYFDGVEVGTIPVDESNLNKRLEFKVPKGQVTNGEALIVYTVQRLGQDPVSSEPVRRVWVQLTQPGGTDSDSEEGNSGLIYTLSPDPSNGVNEDLAQRGIRMNIVPYENIAIFDTIRCRWGDQVVTYYPVTREQIDDPVNHPIFATFTEDVIRAQGNGNNIEVSYQVVDRVGNLPDPKARWAKITYVSVDLNNRLPAPTIWVNGQNVTTIDLKVLGTSDAAARVYFTGPDYQAGDKVVLTWAGTTSGGQPVIVGPLEKTVDSVPGHHDFPIPNDKITAIVNGSAKVGFQLLRAGAPARPSNDIVIAVTGEASQLKPPTVVQAPDYRLNPNLHQSGFTVVFDTSTFGANHEVQLEIAGGPGAGSVPPQHKPVAGQSKVQFDIDSSITGANLQRSVELKYNLIVNGQPTPVQSVTLLIGELLQSSMPMPKLEGFDGEVLDVGMLNDDTKVLCEAWPFQQAGLPIWLRYVETFTSGGERVKEQFVGAAHDQGGGLDYLAEVEWLRGCKADSKLAVVFKVGLHAGAVEGEAVACRVRSYGVKAGLDDLTTFDNYHWNHWAVQYGEGSHPRISFIENEYFLESVPGPQVRSAIQIVKSFQEVEEGDQYELSFDYKNTELCVVIFKQNNEKTQLNVPSSMLWQSQNFRFNAAKYETPKTLMLYLYVGGVVAQTRIKNIRLRKF